MTPLLLQQITCEIDTSINIQFAKGMGTEVSGSSSSFSASQKQLLYLARVLLRRNKFLALDEAISNVDMKTDAFIQEVIRDRFKDTTVITISHRLNTIANYDKVLVMHAGRVEEEGSPFELQEKGSILGDGGAHGCEEC